MFALCFFYGPDGSFTNHNTNRMSVFNQWKSLIPEDFAPDSRVWIYQANRRLGMGEALHIEPKLEAFVDGWQSHGAPVKGYANLFFGQFFVLMADETATGVSGCSTDSSVRLMKSLEQELNITLFDRQLLAFLRNDKVELIPLSQVGYALQNGLLQPDTLYFNNTVLTKQQWQDQWMIPIADSWLKSKLPAA